MVAFLGNTVFVLLFLYAASIFVLTVEQMLSEKPYPDRNARGWTNFYAKISPGGPILMVQRTIFYMTGQDLYHSNYSTNEVGRPQMVQSLTIRGWLSVPK